MSSPINAAALCTLELQITLSAVCVSIGLGSERFLEALPFIPARLARPLSQCERFDPCEKKLKGWRRSRKIALIERTNPRWLGLSDAWEQEPKFYERLWATEEMIRDSSLCSE
jgi:hypothetical protein